MLLSSCSERNPIGRWTEPNRTADGIRSDGGRKPIGRRTETVGGAAVSAAPTKQTGNLLQLSPLGFAACQSKNCTNQANDTNVGGYGIPAVVTQSLNTNILPLIADLQQIIMVRKNNNGFIGLNGFAGCVESVAILLTQNPHIP
jgi:hypothetical protein